MCAPSSQPALWRLGIAGFARLDNAGRAAYISWWGRCRCCTARNAAAVRENLARAGSRIPATTLTASTRPGSRSIARHVRPLSSGTARTWRRSTCARGNLFRAASQQRRLSQKTCRAAEFEFRPPVVRSCLVPAACAATANLSSAPAASRMRSLAAMKSGTGQPLADTQPA